MEFASNDHRTGQHALLGRRRFRFGPDGKGNILFHEVSNDSIQRIASDGTVSVIAGSQYGRVRGWHGAAAGSINHTAWRSTSSGNLIVADTAMRPFRMITPAGVVTTLAVLKLRSSDGAGLRHCSTAPRTLRLDPAARSSCPTVQTTPLREISATGVVTTLAGIAGEAGVNWDRCRPRETSQPDWPMLDPRCMWSRKVRTVCYRLAACFDRLNFVKCT